MDGPVVPEDSAATAPTFTLDDIDARPSRYEAEFAKAAAEVMERTAGDLVVRGGDFLDIDGTSFVRGGDIERYNQAVQENNGNLSPNDTNGLVDHVMSHKDQNFPHDGQIYRSDEVGRYGVNNGVVEYIDPHGRKHMGFVTDERNIEALKAAGYEHTANFSVAFPGEEIIFVNPRNEISNQSYSGFSKEDIEVKVGRLNTRFQEMHRKDMEVHGRRFDEKQAAQQKPSQG